MKYAIFSQLPMANGTVYDILMDDDNGHRENGRYFVGNDEKAEEILGNATKHHAEEWAARMEAKTDSVSIPEPTFIEVK